MKKLLFLSASFMMMATAGFAQQTVVKQQVMKAEAAQTSVKAPVAKAPKKSYADGVYYRRPDGSMFIGIDRQIRSFQSDILSVAPISSPIFINRAPDANVRWEINGNDATQYMDVATGNFNFGSMPLTTENESGSVGGYTLPTLLYGNKSFTFAEDNDKGGMLAVTQNYPLIPQRVTTWYGRGIIKPESATSDNDAYIFGPGNVTFNDGSVAKSVGVAQYLPAPMSPLIVDTVSLHFRSYSTKPLARDVTMEIRSVDRQTDEEGNTVYQIGDEVYETLTATPDNVGIGYESGDVKYWYIDFQKVVTDDLGIPSTSPFVLTKEAFFVINWGDYAANEFDCGFFGFGLDEVDEGTIPEAIPLVTEDGTQIGSFGYASPISLDIAFYGQFDGMQIPTALYGEGTEYADCNIYRAATDGSSVVSENWPDEFGNTVYFTIARPFFDDDSNENYKFTLPDWLTIESAEIVNEESGMYILTLKAEPLPAGMTGRAAQVYIEGVYGGRSEDAIIVLQGDATGINDATVAAPVKVSGTFNFAGQRVNDDFKGLVIKNGVKTVNK